jgi:rhodanese-related sulfurtransferase
MVFRMIELKWPAVPQLATAELARRIDAHESVLLIDTRAKEEYLVSHLPGAVWAESPAQLRAAVRNVPATQLIVLYCSVGVRSSKAAAMLMRDGGHTVVNLRGSLFQWANEGRALEADGRPAVRVHPYNRLWGQLLEPRLRVSGAP